MPGIDDILDEASDAVELDLSGAVDFDDCPNGVFILKVNKLETTTSALKEGGGGGEPMIKWSFVVEETISLVDQTLSAPAKGSYAPLVRTMLTGKGAGITKKLLKALGNDIDTKAGSNIRFSPNAQKGRLVKATVQQQLKRPEYQEVTKFEPAPSAAGLE